MVWPMSLALASLSRACEVGGNGLKGWWEGSCYNQAAGLSPALVRVSVEHLRAEPTGRTERIPFCQPPHLLTQPPSPDSSNQGGG